MFYQDENSSTFILILRNYPQPDSTLKVNPLHVNVGLGGYDLELETD